MSEGEAAAQEPGTTNQAGESAPQNNDGKNNGSQQEGSAAKQNGGAQAGVKREFFNLREKVRTEREEKEQLRSELEALKARLASPGNGSSAKAPDPLEDPEAYSTSLEQRAREAAKKEFNDLLSQHNVQASAVHSNEWLRSRSHLEDDNRAADEVAEIIATRYAHLTRGENADPRAAARNAYLDWCEAKGVAPDLSSNNFGSNPPRHAKPSRAGSGTSNSDKVYTPAEVSKTLASLGSKAAIDAYVAEVEKAAREGRYKGKFIQLG